MRLSTVAIALVLWSACAAASQAAPQVNTCVFTKTSGHWDGTCGELFDHHPSFSIAVEPAVASGAWRTDRSPVSAWAGVMGEAGVRTTRVEVEAYPDGTGILRTMVGWYALSNVTATAAVIRFDLDASHELAPGALDRQIIQRAAAILSSEAVWNRADNRLCNDGATSWSIYCAMRLATIQVTGGFHHRRPALALVRQVVGERAKGRDYDHGLMDYNNDRATRLADVQSLFAEAERRIPAGER